MKSTDTITVLVCCHSQDYRHDVMLVNALNSLKNQTYEIFDVVLVLDECWDETVKHLDDHSCLDGWDIQVHERPHKKGLANAKNFGLKFCTGDWIAYLDGDDTWMDCKLEIQRDYLLDFQTIDLCGTEAWDSYDGTLKPNCFKVGQYQHHKDIAEALPRENVLCHGSMLIRAKVLEELDGYIEAPETLGREDHDLWLRALAAGYKFGKVPERLYLYGMGTSVPR
jgi:glycosyltransferase involved in cell wall biosynthesis